MAAICPTNKSRVILPVNSNSKLFNVAGQKDGYSSTNCPRAIKLSNEESAVSNYTEILISIVRCRGAGRLLFTCELSACVYFKIHHSIFNIRHSISVEALSFLGVPRGLLPTLGLLQWRGLGGLVKGDSPTSPTSCALSHLTNIIIETWTLWGHRTPPLQQAIVVCCPLPRLCSQARRPSCFHVVRQLVIFLIPLFFCSIIPFPFPFHFFLSPSPFHLPFSLPFSLSLLIFFSIVLWLRKSQTHLRYVHLQRFVQREMLCHIIKTFSILFSIVQCRGVEKLFFTYELSAGVASEFSFPIRQQKFFSVEVVSIFLDVPAGGTQRLCFCSGGHRRP